MKSGLLKSVAAIMSLTFAQAMAANLNSAPRAEVLHWWTSGGEAAAAAKFAAAYRAAGGIWQDTAVAGGEQARAVAINRMVGGNPPTAAQFNISRQFFDIVDQGMLAEVDELARREAWDKRLPEPINSVIKIQGHYYAVPVNIHMPAWIWYSKAAFAKAGISKEPANIDEFFAALDKLKAAGVIALAHGGQAWQENILFQAMLANQGGKELYLKVLRDRDTNALQSEAFKKVLVLFKRLRGYVDTAAPGRNWNDATSLLIQGKAGVQIMGDWVNGEFAAAKLQAGKDYGCLPGLSEQTPYLIQGDVLVFPKNSKPEVQRAQKLLADVVVNPANQLAFNLSKGSLPVRDDVDASRFDSCAQKGWAVLRDKNRHVGVGEIYLTPDQQGALDDVLTAYWNSAMSVEKAQKALASALRR